MTIDKLVKEMVKFRLSNEPKNLNNKVCNHVACIFDPKRGTPLTMGMNYSPVDCKVSCHAEMDAFSRLRVTRRVKTVNIIVIRFNASATVNDYKLLLSKPCLCCTLQLNQMSKKGYNLKRVYYSTDDDNIIYDNFDSLLKQNPQLTDFDKYRLTCSDDIFLVSMPTLPSIVRDYLRQQVLVSPTVLSC